MNWSIVYAKFDGCSSYRAFDIQNGVQVYNIIYASLVENTEENRKKLQRLADNHKDVHLSIQLRKGQRIVFQTV